jgi:hypothetical protein
MSQICALISHGTPQIVRTFVAEIESCDALVHALERSQQVARDMVPDLKAKIRQVTRHLSFER